MIMLWLFSCISPVLEDDTTTKTDTSSPPEPWVCPQTQDAESIGEVEHDELTEISGISFSAVDPDRIWAHNDSGDSAQLYALRADGRHEGIVALDVLALDWEDMTQGSNENGDSYLFVGDIGDNDEIRSNIVIHQFLEPVVFDALPTVESIVLSYPDAPHNAEALVVHPQSNSLYILTKSVEQTQIFLVDMNTQTLTQTNELHFFDLEIVGSPLVTGASISPDGDTLLLRTYTSVVAMSASVLNGTFPEEICMLTAPQEEQGESISFVPDGSAYVTMSEGLHPHVYRVDLD
jgi:hypothetical protein